MMFNVKEIDDRYDFVITGMSYIGAPVNGTCMFIGPKLSKMLSNLKEHSDCLVFIDRSIPIPEEYRIGNCFVQTEDPQREYGEFSLKMKKIEEAEQTGWQYRLTPEGYYIGENVEIGEYAHIEPSCLIGHNVKIGQDAYIGFGSTIRNAEIGDHFRCHENAMIGTESFNIGTGDGVSYRIPSFGKVVIGSHVDLGAHVIIERGFNTNTVLMNNVKIDSDVNIGHDAVLEKDVRIACGVCVAGRVVVSEGAYIGMNATIHQRIVVGAKSIVGMGSSVMTRVKNNTTVLGNPARRLKI